MSKTLFEKIIDGEIPGDIVFEDDQCVAFRDINPTAPMHILLVPRKPIPRLCDATDEDAPVLGHMLRVAPQIAESQGLGDAFRLVIIAHVLTRVHLDVHIATFDRVIYGVESSGLRGRLFWKRVARGFGPR